MLYQPSLLKSRLTPAPPVIFGKSVFLVYNKIQGFSFQPQPLLNSDMDPVRNLESLGNYTVYQDSSQCFWQHQNFTSNREHNPALRKVLFLEKRFNFLTLQYFN